MNAGILLLYLTLATIFLTYCGKLTSIRVNRFTPHAFLCLGDVLTISFQNFLNFAFLART